MTVLVCAECGWPLVPTFFGPIVGPETDVLASSVPCRGDYPVYEENGMHVAMEVEPFIPDPIRRFMLRELSKRGVLEQLLEECL